MGGKNPTIVLADADFNSAVENVVNAAFFSTGQKCTATSRAIVEDAIYDRFVEAVVERTKKLKVGDGMQAGHRDRPVRRQGAAGDRPAVHRDRPQGRRRACCAAAAGSPAARYDKGYFVEPTVFADVTGDDAASRRKRSSDRCSPSCAPRISTTPCAIANDMPFGLSASIQTTNLSRVFEYIYGAEAGLLTVNLPSAGVEYQLPFGGTKESSFGPKEQGPAALEFYSDYKTVYLKY